MAATSETRPRASVRALPTIGQLRLLLLTAVPVSIVHYLDNTLRWKDFVAADPNDAPFSFIKRWTIPVTWIAFTACAVLGYRAFQRRRWAQAAMWLALYSGSGLAGFGHYVDIPVSQLSVFQNAHVITDIALGILIFLFATWIVLRLPQLPRPDEQG